MKYVARNVFCVTNSSARGVVGGGGGWGGGGGGGHSVAGSGKPILKNIQQTGSLQ